MQFRIYQLPHNNNNIFRHFKEGTTIDLGDYCCVWHQEVAGAIGDEDKQLARCEAIFAIFNINRPDTFGGHSLSVSDIVELYDDEDEGHQEFYYCDAVGFKKVTSNVIH